MHILSIVCRLHHCHLLEPLFLILYGYSINPSRKKTIKTVKNYEKNVDKQLEVLLGNVINVFGVSAL